MTAPAPRLRPDRSAVFWLAQAGGWGAYGLSTFLTLLPSLPQDELGAYLAAKLLRAAVGLGLSLALHRLYRAMLRSGAPLRLILAAAVPASGALGALWLLVYRAGIAPALLRTPPPFGWELFPRAALDLAFVLFAWSGIYLGMHYWQALQDRAREVVEARRLAEDARFRMLSYQLNPHFLFNSLNSIRALVGEDPARAREMVTRLAEFLRYPLAEDPARQVTLAEEMEVIDHYLAIEAIRFEERLRVEREVDPAALGCLVPVFLVHPLVENALKHGTRAPGRPLRVRVAAHLVGGRLRVEVASSGPLRNGHAEGTGTGLRTIRGRLEHLHPGRHRLELREEGERVRVVVELPAVRERAREATHA